MTMREALEQAKASFIARLPEEAQEAVFGHIREQIHSGQTFGLGTGDLAPHFTLSGSLGDQVSLYDELLKGPVVIIFYRGAWCPYCNIQLRAFEQRLADIRALGAQLIAISPQNPDHTLSQKEKEELSFHVLSDPDGHVAERYKLLFELPDYLQQTFLNVMKRDLTVYNASNLWVLPVPATLVIDQVGIIQFASVNPDFMERTDPQYVIEQLEKLR
ncbi:alkyl hydroperoxide reductase [Paenibacillus sp. CCS19]|uniref:peroxiredoxin-like family protein n=1 Tax=Paenibacillus sp. CCS19 TaxID=3158387 RepID=UPI002569ACA7|nr:peroxiredoxin-like family protein [Paenibacillus cellulosilyticus]GMK38800.1 alkyl hydroperoxide reductase [Paenibacillus cellulosilyticus]